MMDIDVSLSVADVPNEYDEDDANDEHDDERVQASDNDGHELWHSFEPWHS